ncbi:MAG TPA: hypothetical protein VK589_14495 [Chryseolinea sp.]|nr:hypothetical protein [Chryseolinea sp.]
MGAVRAIFVDQDLHSCLLSQSKHLGMVIAFVKRCCSYVVHYIMKIKTLVLTLALGSSVLLTNEALGQEVSTSEEQRQIQKTADAKTLSDLKDKKSDSKLEAQEAQRVETAATNSAKASKSAYKTEKKAQKARKHADAQAKKAAKAKEKLDN